MNTQTEIGEIKILNDNWGTYFIVFLIWKMFNFKNYEEQIQTINYFKLFVKENINFEYLNNIHLKDFFKGTCVLPFTLQIIQSPCMIVILSLIQAIH